VLLPRFVAAAGRIATLGSARGSFRRREQREPGDFVRLVYRSPLDCRERERERERGVRNYRCNVPVFRYARDALHRCNDAANARNVTANYPATIWPSSYFDITFDGSRLRRLTRACSRFAIANLILLPVSARARARARAAREKGIKMMPRLAPARCARACG